MKTVLSFPGDPDLELHFPPMWCLAAKQRLGDVWHLARKDGPAAQCDYRISLAPDFARSAVIDAYCCKRCIALSKMARQ